MTEKPCPFCGLPAERVLGQNAHALWIRDGYPVSPGHSLVIPKRHIGSFFETIPQERAALLELLDQAQAAAAAAAESHRMDSTLGSMMAPLRGRQCRTFTSISFRATWAISLTREVVCGG
ncbi:diadenosine tetraphosphate (Ap4A) HIT family hydrolase [Variovorax paradoxus]|nr:diadenosine tetraphosphate (Ap4A) HIT family hydrolase [Variovorax paradoxus]